MSDVVRAAEVLGKLRRAHEMGCSDPSDPTKRTTYSEAADVIADLAAKVAAIEEALMLATVGRENEPGDYHRGARRVRVAVRAALRGDQP